MKKLLQSAVLWVAGLVGIILMFLRPRPSLEDARVSALKAEAERLRALADEQRARHDADAKAKVEAIEAERAKPVDSVAFANELLKD